MNYFVSNKNSIFVCINNKTTTVDKTFPNFETIKDLVKQGRWDEANNMIDLEFAVNEFGDGRIVATQGVVTFDGYAVSEVLSRRMLKMISEEVDCSPLVNFLLNLGSNPDKRAVEETYDFLDQNDLPLTPDGCFMAYKNVNDDYKDKHSGTFDNSIGSICEMPRNRVCADKNRTCSDGLHFCSLEYLQGFWGTSGHTMLIKINPRDVVSIPVDYNNSKGRCSRYEVVAEADFGGGVEEQYEGTVFVGDEEFFITLRKGQVWGDEDNTPLYVRSVSTCEYTGQVDFIKVQHVGGDNDKFFYVELNNFITRYELKRDTKGEILYQA